MPLPKNSTTNIGVSGLRVPIRVQNDSISLDFSFVFNPRESGSLLPRIQKIIIIIIIIAFNHRDLYYRGFKKI